MRAPRFWSLAPDQPAARLLAPLGHLYGARAAARMDRPGARAALPVICLGNLTMGGAGKTPAALALARMLMERGHRPAFLSRGYGGRLQGPVAVDPARHGAAEVGDEPLLLARLAATVVSRDRPAGAALCAGLGADAILMDDGLQNPSLVKDLAFAVVDGGAGIGNGLTFPAGPLRAPLHRQWRHIHGLILVGAGAPGEAVAREALARGLPVHRATIEADGQDFTGRRWLAFAGIGRPEKFFATLREIGADPVATHAFPDHHAYRPGELEGLAREADRLGAELVTTEKDRVRLPPAFAARALPVRLRLADEAALWAEVERAIARPAPP
ncbi:MULTISPECIES: tetraacyldisaccharide 4'-kinase [Methylobacterium]|uniref:Tetraacyldisaccharide 4'-kinase n=1 Tax=Methylobacterium jeotgali TaxID=381630 RepID=A0ABQ4T0D9_9HYPH|nr:MULTISPECIES: tetraacyldisaccharide 4'-kinase [Methylobacterium]PIU05811.1 MAG: tetraacyldisaccharide 4'-kinase [Methylobacterium sp. CG09_land_8_20_14_0_10_71_15]PIU13922.1 MAG: tetraacyldisaccharide 4'-kinase [Methylobacterium sp. CG08_land_8_20_14_0_20_71_15]GBU17388.1 lipid A 4'kinase [Methylobacterium sp.]GJE07683.1 Tetraacyldisaccharide 4'-kinase [Methylobacterium jeotgali]